MLDSFRVDAGLEDVVFTETFQLRKLSTGEHAGKHVVHCLLCSGSTTPCHILLGSNSASSNLLTHLNSASHQGNIQVEGTSRRNTLHTFVARGKEHPARPSTYVPRRCAGLLPGKILVKHTKRENVRLDWSPLLKVDYGDWQSKVEFFRDFSYPGVSYRHKHCDGYVMACVPAAGTTPVVDNRPLPLFDPDTYPRCKKCASIAGSNAFKKRLGKLEEAGEESFLDRRVLETSQGRVARRRCPPDGSLHLALSASVERLRIANRTIRRHRQSTVTRADHLRALVLARSPLSIAAAIAELPVHPTWEGAQQAKDFLVSSVQNLAKDRHHRRYSRFSHNLATALRLYASPRTIRLLSANLPGMFPTLKTVERHRQSLAVIPDGGLLTTTPQRITAAGQHYSAAMKALGDPFLPIGR